MGASFGDTFRGEFVHGVLQSLANELARAINVGALLENERDLRQAELGERPQLDHSGNAGHLHFERKGDELFDFLRGEALDLGVDLHLDVGDVRHGIDRQATGRPETGRPAARRRRAKQTRAGAGKIQ